MKCYAVWTTVAWLCGSSFAFAIPELTGLSNAAVVVPNVNLTAEGGAQSGLLNTPLRHQIVYRASQFSVELMKITELRLRPSAYFGGAFTSTIPNLQINLSTTSAEPNQLSAEPNQLSRIFAQNVGADEAVVFQGPLTVSSRFVGPANGPKEFDIVIPLTTPFLYDRSRGNLLIDFRNASGSSASRVDLGQGIADGASRMSASGVDATSAIESDFRAEVLQIVYTPQTEVPPLVYLQPNSRSAFAGETVTLTVRVWGSPSLSYQWLRDGTAIADATNATLVLTNVQLADLGGYLVVVSNAYGVVTSQSAMLTLSESSGLVVPNINRTVDGGAGSGLLNRPLRHQVVYHASLFPVEIMNITELRLRPSAWFGNAFTATISNLQINLSTTSIEPHGLSGTFAQNVGTNDTVVFQGPLTVSSRFVGPANGPKEFDIIIPLTTPFLYDPSRGNLLIDFRNASGSGASLIDTGRLIDDGASRQFATSVDATSSTEADAGAEVFQLVYTPQREVPPLIFAQPPSRTAFLGETVTLTLGVLGSPSLTYQWRKDGTAIPDATNAALVLTNVQLAAAGSYSVAVSNAFGTATSQTATLTVSESSPLVVPTVSRTIDDGGGSGLLNTPLRYQIVYDDSLFPVEIMRITELRLRPSSQFGRAFAATISDLQINLSTTSVEPNQLNQIFARNVGADEVVVFHGPLTVSSRFVGPANGPKEFDIIIPLTTPFLYDPSRGNLLIDFRNVSGSSATYVDIGQGTNDGASRVFATAVDATSAGGADSAADVFQIVYTPQTEVPPLIFAQPPSRSTFLGETVTLTVGVSGSPPLNYQWGRDGVPIPDATNAILVLTNANLSQAGNYSVVASNAFGEVTSQTATLTVSEGPVLVVPTVNRTIDGGGSGSGLLNTPLRQQTVYDDSLFPDEIMRITELRMRPSARFGHPFTATISNLQINLSTTSVEPNQLKSIFAQNVGLDEVVVFQGPLTVSSQFVGPANGPKEFDIILPLTTPFLYDSSRGNLLIEFRNASGSSASLVDRGNRSDDGASRLFATSVDATSAAGADSGAEVLQIVYTPQTEVPPLIFAQPQSRFTFSGETVTLTVGASGSRPLNYQWLKGDTAIAGGTNAVLALANVQLADAGSYSVVVSNAFGKATSQMATLTVSERLVVPNVSWTIDDGGGSGLLNTQLRYQIVYHASLFPVEIMRITELRMRPSARFGNAFTSTIPNLQINFSTTSVEPNQLNGTFAQNVGSNEVVVFQGPLTVSSRFVGPANGPKEFDIILPLTTPFLYDPSRGNLLIDFRNASGSSASFVDIGQRTDDGASRLFAASVDATSATGADSGAEVFQLVYTQSTPPSIFAQPPSRTAFLGQTVTLTVGASGSRPLSYQWHQDAAVIPNATKATLVLTNIQSSQAGNYSVVVSNAFGVVTSETATLTVSPTMPEAHYDLSYDFSLASNPNGVWSYGRQDGIGGAFTLLGTTRTNFANFPILLWAIFPSSRPRILHNDTTETLIIAEGTYPPETTWFAPAIQGGPGNYAVARFTVPAGGDGAYQLVTTALPAFNASVQMDTDFHVVRNNVEIFAAQLSGTQIAHYTDTLALVAGDTIDFAVGRGADNSYVGSELKVDAMLTKLFSNLQVSITNVSGNGRTLALTFNGPLGNYAIEASTNLIDWVILTNVVDVPGQVRVTDPAINSLRQRFYRARLAP